MTNKQLLMYHKELTGMRGSILYHFHRGRISEFYKQNSIRINSLMEKVGDLNKEFFQYDGNKLKIGENKKPLVLEGKTEGEFDLRLNELLEREVNIIL